MSKGWLSASGVVGPLSVLVAQAQGVFVINANETSYLNTSFLN